MLYGAIYGDILGSTHEYIGITGAETHEQLLTERSTFTDDTILTLAVADALMNRSAIGKAIRLYATIYNRPMGGYGSMFVDWLMQGDNAKPYGSFGNGSAMRCSACAWVANSIEEAKMLARRSAKPTHNHPEGIKGAEATAACIYMARTGFSKKEIRRYVHKHYYDMSRDYEEVYNNEPYTFHATCQETVPLAILSFLYADTFEDTLRYAMLVDKDTDTIGAIAGAIAEAYYGVSEDVRRIVREKLDAPLLKILDRFERRYNRNVEITVVEHTEEYTTGIVKPWQDETQGFAQWCHGEMPSLRHDTYRHFQPKEMSAVSVEIKHIVKKVLKSGREKKEYGFLFRINGEVYPICFGSKDQTMLYACTLLRQKMNEKMYLHEFYNNDKGRSPLARFKRQNSRRWLNAVYDSLFPHDTRDFRNWIENVENKRARPLNQGKSETTRHLAALLESQPAGFSHCAVNTREDALGDSYYDVMIEPERIILPDEMLFLINDFSDLMRL